MSDDLIKSRVMKRVYAIWFVKKIAPAIFLYLPFLLAVALRETANEFFVAKIVENFLSALHHGLAGTFGYLVSAAASASLIPVLIILVSCGLFVVILWRIVRSFRSISLVKSC